MHLFLFPRGMGKENVALHKKCFQGKNNAIFDWLVDNLFGIWLVWVWFDWFVAGLEFYSQRPYSDPGHIKNSAKHLKHFAKILNGISYFCKKVLP